MLFSSIHVASAAARVLATQLGIVRYTSRVCVFLTHHMSSRRHLWRLSEHNGKFLAPFAVVPSDTVLRSIALRYFSDDDNVCIS